MHTDTCADCDRHAHKHSELFKLLPSTVQDDLQRQLCDNHPGGSCSGDPFGSWEAL